MESVVIRLNNITRKSSYVAEASHAELVEGIPVSLSCTASGGYPPPQVTIIIGNSDITHTFETAVNQTLLPGSGRGLRYIKHETNLWTPRYVPQADADQQVLQCSAAVTGLQAVLQRIHLNVCCKSLICFSRLDDDLEISITINSRTTFYFEIALIFHTALNY